MFNKVFLNYSYRRILMNFREMYNNWEGRIIFTYIASRLRIRTNIAPVSLRASASQDTSGMSPYTQPTGYISVLLSH